MSSINFQVNDLNCPYCNRDSLTYQDTEHYMDHAEEEWTCDDCHKTFFVHTRTQILKVVTSD